MEKIKEWIKNFISKYIVAEDPYDESEEEIFQARKKQFEEWQRPVEKKIEPPKPVKKKRGRPKKKK